jgi:hypothetical protein
VSAELEKVMADLDAHVRDGVVDLALEVTANLIEKTPVQYGFARASWIPSIGVHTQATGGAEKVPNSAAQQSGIALVASSYQPYAPVYVTNNVRYIGRLNDGSSTQAPAGYVQTEIARAVKTVSQRRSR